MPSTEMRMLRRKSDTGQSVRRERRERRQSEVSLLHYNQDLLSVPSLVLLKPESTDQLSSSLSRLAIGQHYNVISFKSQFYFGLI